MLKDAGVGDRVSGVLGPTEGIHVQHRTKGAWEDLGNNVSPVPRVLKITKALDFSVCLVAFLVVEAVSLKLQ